MATPEETAAAAAAAAAGQQKPFYEGFDADTLGYMQNRGLDKKSLKDAFAEVVQAHKNAEQRLGAPADKLLRLLEPNAPPEQVKAFWEKLGAPKDAKDYDFKDVIRNIGDKQVPLDDKTQEFLRQVAGSSFLTKEAATNLAKGYAKYQDAVDTAAAANKAAMFAAEDMALKGLWTNKYDANMFVAQQAAAKAGFTPQMVKLMEGQAGYAATMEAFRKWGMAIGEGRFIINEQGGGEGSAMTVGAAKDAKDALMADKAFLKKLTAGDAEAKKKMSDLNMILSGVLNTKAA